eukprot:COSAG02_NODE_254_length_26937_cov_16.503950_25_plen_500_part_00
MVDSTPGGELQQPSPVATSPPRVLPPLVDVPPSPATPQGAGEQEVPVKHASRRSCCCGTRHDEDQSRNDVVHELKVNTGSPRDKQRYEAREANRVIWEPVCNLLWTTDGSRWTMFTRILVLAHIVALANSTFNLYALLQMWEHRLEFGLTGVVVLFSGFLVRVLLKVAHRDGDFVRICSFIPASDADLAATRNFARCLMTCAGVCVMGWVLALVLVFGSSYMDSETKLQLDQYGGHGGTWVGVTNFALDLSTFCCVFLPPFLLFLYMLRTSSAVAVAAAHYVVSEIGDADEDVETDVSEALRCRIGPWVQTLVEEILVPLSKCWSAAVAASVLSFLGLAFASLPTLIDATASAESHAQALQTVILCPLCAVAIVYSPAKVTTVCEEISFALNELRTAGVGTGAGMVHSDTDANICVIETWLSNLNEKQGPGFVLFGTVVNKRLLLTVASKVAGYVTVAVQALQQLQAPQGPVGAVDDQLGIGTYTMTVTGQGTSIVGPN